MSKSSLLFCASEVYPFAKTGGLADVAHSLPKALQESQNVKVVLPLYQSIDKEEFSIKTLGVKFSIFMNNVEYPVEVFSTDFEGVKYLFIYSELLSEKEFLYGKASADYEDNAIRFAIFNRAIIELLKREHYDIVHLNDWQSALVPLLLQEESLTTKSVLTIHNLAFQGLFAYEELQKIGVDSKYFTMDVLEFYNNINFLKAGIAYADAITTVSENYAQEILTPEYGVGLEGFLRKHQHKLTGILNGIDQDHFNPINDKLLVQPFSTLTKKSINKKAYLRVQKLKGIKKPLFVFIGRLATQKGVDLLIESLDELAQEECNIAIIGEGEDHYQDALTTFSDNYTNIHYECSYNEELSHQMYAAADFLLMPSFFEPCGLNQMIAMSYGAIPIVHRVGGLKDSVQNYKYYDKSSDKGYGITFKQATPKDFITAFKEGLSLYAKKREYNVIVKHNMLCDFSFSQSAKLYTEIYNQL